MADRATSSSTRRAGHKSEVELEGSSRRIRDGGLMMAEELRACALMKADIVAHPLFDSLLRAHMQCLHVMGALPFLRSNADMNDDMAQVAHRHHTVALKYLTLRKLILGDQYVVRPPPPATPNHGFHARELDAFMEMYLQHLLTCKKHLDAMVRPPTIMALSTLSQIQQAFCHLTGVSFNDDNETLNESGSHLEGTCLELDDVASEIESPHDIDRSLFEHLQAELKLKLKESYKETLMSMRDEIIRKRQAGILRGDISALKEWWTTHSKWPYPTEADKRKLMERTGLELRQINNWFINHRKRNWAERDLHLGSSSQHSS